MKPSSAKAKGRGLCKYVKERILNILTGLEEDDIKVTSSGAGGEDLQFSPAARKLLPISIECKSRARFNVYEIMKQAIENAGNNQPVLVLKQNACKPLVVVDLDYFLTLHK
jgi:hypothetical protein